MGMDGLPSRWEAGGTKTSAPMTPTTSILLVDDNAAILESTARYLRSRNFAVICSEEPLFGVPSLMREHKPAVIVLDVVTDPRPLGREPSGATTLRAQGHTAAIIYYSAMQEEQLYALAQKTTNTSYVLKSDWTGHEVLFQAISRVTEGKR